MPSSGLMLIGAIFPGRWSLGWFLLLLLLIMAFAALAFGMISGALLVDGSPSCC